MPIEISEIEVNAKFIDGPTGKIVIVKQIKPMLGKGSEREVYGELPEKPECGVWQSERLFAETHSKMS